VIGVSESGDGGKVTALVGQKPHGSAPVVAGSLADEDNLFVRDCVRRITHGGVNVIACEARVRVDQIHLGGAFAELAQDELDRNPGPSDHRLPEHHVRIDFNAIGERHAAILPCQPNRRSPSFASFCLASRCRLDDAPPLSAIMTRNEDEERGYPPYHPVMLTKVLVYAYCVGVFSSRRIQQRLVEDIAFRVLAAGNAPDFRTIADFRKTHLMALRGLFEQVLQLARELGTPRVGRVALDGSKIKANASKHKAMSYGRMREKQRRPRDEVKDLLAQAEAADAAEDAEYGSDRRGDELPAELQRRESRLKRIREAKHALEARAKAEAAAARESGALLRRVGAAGGVATGHRSGPAGGSGRAGPTPGDLGIRRTVRPRAAAQPFMGGADAARVRLRRTGVSAGSSARPHPPVTGHRAPHGRSQVLRIAKRASIRPCPAVAYGAFSGSPR